MDAELDDPSYDCNDCPTCDIRTEIETGGSHLWCELTIGDKYCIHGCDGDDYCFFLVEPEEYVIFGEDYSKWYNAVNYPSEIHYNCSNCKHISNRVNADSCNCSKNKYACWECATCPNCDERIDLSRLCTPFSVVLKCNAEYCTGDFISEGDDWPEEYYCPCCGTGPNEWDVEQKHFWCDDCEKFHEEDESFCCYYDHESGYTSCRDEDDDDDDDDEQGNTLAKTQINLETMKVLEFQRSDGYSYFSTPCKNCFNPLHAQIKVSDLDEFFDSEFWKRRKEVISWPETIFPSIKQVDALPEITEDDFEKGDFQKGDFKKGDFQKGDLQ